MQKTTNFNDNTFFLLKQYKIFHLVEYHLKCQYICYILF